MFIVCCLLFVVNCLLFVGHYVLFFIFVCCSLFVVCCLLFFVLFSGQFDVGSRFPSRISHSNGGL